MGDLFNKFSAMEVCGLLTFLDKVLEPGAEVETKLLILGYQGIRPIDSREELDVKGGLTGLLSESSSTLKDEARGVMEYDAIKGEKKVEKTVEDMQIDLSPIGLDDLVDDFFK